MGDRMLLLHVYLEAQNGQNWKSFKPIHLTVKSIALTIISSRFKL